MDLVAAGAPVELILELAAYNEVITAPGVDRDGIVAIGESVPRPVHAIVQAAQVHDIVAAAAFQF